MSSSGVVIVLTGALPSGKSRKDKTKEIEAWGASVKKSVTNTCTHLVVSDINSVTKKTKEAKKKNVQVIDEDTLDRMMGTFSASKSSSSKQNSSSSSSSSTTTSSKTKTKVKKNANAGKNAKAKSKASSTKTKAKSTSTAKQKNDGGAISLQNMAPPSNNSSVIDPGCTFAGGAIPQVHSSFHCKLAKVDKAKNEDKYYFMQLVTVPLRCGGCNFYLYTRYGRTGKGGMCEMVTYQHADHPQQEAIGSFSKLFKSKTGLTWTQRNNKAKKNKYVYTLSASKNQPNQICQYLLQNDPQNKPDGWYDYSDAASTILVGCFSQWLASGQGPNLNTRLISSGNYVYLVDFGKGTQTNQTSGTTRPIRVTKKYCGLNGSSSSSSSSSSRTAIVLPQCTSVPIAPTARSKKGKKRKAARPPTPSLSSLSSTTTSSSSTSSTSTSSLPLPLKKKPRTKTVKSKPTTVVLNNGSLATPANGTVDPYVPINLQPRCFNGNSSGGGLNGSVYGK